MINAIATKAISQAFNKSLKDAVLPFTGSRKGFGGDGGVYDPIRDEFVNPTFLSRLCGGECWAISSYTTPTVDYHGVKSMARIGNGAQ